MLNKRNIKVIELFEISVFRNILSDQALGVFIGSSFPRSIGMSKIGVSIQCLRDFFMSSECLAVVTGDCMNWIPFQQVNHALSDSFFAPLFYQTHAQEPAFSDNQGHNGPFHSFPNDSISFPVATTLIVYLQCLDAPLWISDGVFCLAYRCLHLVCDTFSSAGDGGTVVRHAFIFPNMLVDPFGTDLNANFFQNPVSGLFGAEILSQIALNDQPILCCDPFSGFVLSPFRHPLGLLVSVPSFARVSLQFAADG
jgi:hypothetical protein